MQTISKGFENVKKKGAQSVVKAESNYTVLVQQTSSVFPVFNVGKLSYGRINIQKKEMRRIGFTYGLKKAIQYDKLLKYPDTVNLSLKG